jgi:hypothetical protein
MADAGGRGLAAAAFGLTLVGVGLLYSGLADASPLTWGYTEEERTAAHDGRIVVAASAGVLAGAAGLVALRGRHRRAAVVALPGVVCWALAAAFPPPGGAWALLAFVPLAPAALIAAAPTGARRDPL